jgi:hypothetical protein
MAPQTRSALANLATFLALVLCFALLIVLARTNASYTPTNAAALATVLASSR